MKKKALRKDFYMEVRKSLNRFLSIMLIVALGVAFYSGIQSAAPDMRYSGDAYFDEHKLMDLKVVGTLGLTDNDVDALLNVKGISKAEPGYMTDVLCGEETQRVLRVESISETLNQLTPSEGRLPEKSGEIFVDIEFLDKAGYEIGDEITFSLEDEDNYLLKQHTFTIVGAGSSPLYIAFSRGNTTLGNGELGGVGYVLPEDFDSEVYTQIYLEVKGARNLTAYTDAYDSLIETVMDRVEDIAGERCEIRYQEVLDDANEELADAEQELEDGRTEGESELADAKEELEQAESELADGKQELEDAKQKVADAEQEIADGEQEIADSKATLEEKEQELADAKQQVADGWAQLESGKSELAENEAKLADSEEELAAGEKKLEEAKQELKDGREEYEAGMASYQLYLTGEKQYAAGVTALEEGKAEWEKQKAVLETQKAGLEASKTQLESSVNLDELNQQLTELEGNKSEAQSAKDNLQSQLEALNANITEAQQTVTRLESQQSSAQSEVDAAQTAVNDAQANVDASQETVDNCQINVNVIQAEIDTLNGEIENLQNSISNEEGKEAPDTAQIEAWESELAEKQNSLSAKNNELVSANNELSAAQEIFTTAQNNLTTTQNDLETKKEALSTVQENVTAAQNGLAQAQAGVPALESGISQAEASLSQVQSGIDKINAGITEYNTNLNQIETGIGQIEAGITQGDAQIAASEQTLTENRATLDAAKAKLEASGGEEALKAAKEQLDSGAAEIAKNEKTIEDGKVQLESGRQQIASAKQQIADSEQTLNDSQAQITDGEQQIADGWAQIADAEAELADGKKELEDGKQEITDGEKEIEENEQKIADGWKDYEDGVKEFDEEIADAEEKIADAKQEIADIKEPEWTVSDRSDLPDNIGYGENADRMRNIGEVFPVLFFLVAALISLTTMTRMVEEERTQIGTLKALGYSKASIAAKYMGYALAATLVGSIVGILFGEKFLPYVIVVAYHIMYQHMPNLVLPYNMKYAFIAMGAALVSTLGATFAACYKELASTPAVLMRPPAPKEGKRVLLERIPLIWKHLSFTWKSTVRNLFRYKKRLLMTIFGISGCMGLMIVGYGLRDSIMDIANLQYTELQIYDGMVVLDSDASEEDKEDLKKQLDEDSRVDGHIEAYLQKYNTYVDGKLWDLYLMVPENVEAFEQFVNFRDRTTHEAYELTDEGAILTEKIAKALDLSPGDTITVRVDDDTEVEVPVAAITENYLSHYIYLTPAMYEKYFGETVEYNDILYRVTEENKDEVSAVGEDLMTNDAALSISYTASLMSQVDDMLSALDSVIYVLIISAGLLAFVVLYNLNNININERKRELATIKVLGFYDGEVSAYVYRENILITIIGIFAGVGLGKLLHRFIITTVEIDSCMFGRNINVSSFLLASAFTAAFSIFVNVVMHFKLKKIDMVESLKSVE